MVLALEDAFQGERVLVHRPLTIRHPNHFFVQVLYNKPELCLRSEANNSQNTHLQLTDTNLHLLYKTNLNWDILYDDVTTFFQSLLSSVSDVNTCYFHLHLWAAFVLSSRLFSYFCLYSSSNKRKSLALHGSKRSLNHPFRCVFRPSCSSNRSVYPISSNVIQLPCSPLFKYLRLHHAVNSATSSCLSFASGSASFLSR